MFKPALYTETNGKQRRDANDISQEFSKELGKMSGRCLDIGSGSCDVVADFILPKLSPDATIICSDISESMLQFGKEMYRDNQRMSFVQLDIETPDLPENLMGQFDHVTSFYCLHWCYDIRQAFKNILNLLQPGGTAFLVFIADNPVRNTYRAMASLPIYQPYMKDVDRHIPVYYNSERRCEFMRALIRSVGFDIHHFSHREKSYIYEDPTLIGNLLLALNPFIERMPTDLREKYEKDLVREFERQCIVFNKNDNDHEYGILSTYSLFIAHLKKPFTK